MKSSYNYDIFKDDIIKYFDRILGSEFVFVTDVNSKVAAVLNDIDKREQKDFIDYLNIKIDVLRLLNYILNEKFEWNIDSNEKIMKILKFFI